MDGDRSAGGLDGPSRIREAYPDPTWDKFKAIKHRYDPANFFRLNQNLPPSARAHTT